MPSSRARRRREIGARGMARVTPGRRPDRVLVLGGTGFLGTEIAAAFVAAGVPTSVAARHAPDERHARRLAGAEVVLGDAEEPGFLDELLEGVTDVVHAVGCPFPAESNLDPVGDVERTLPGFLEVLQVLRRHPGIRFTFLSSGGTVYGNPEVLPVGEEAPCDPTTSYGILKLAAEKYVGLYRMLYGIDGHVLRVSNAYGPLQLPGRGQGVVAAFLASARRGNPVHLYGDGTILRDYVHATDVASALVALSSLDELPGVCNVGSGIGRTVAEVLRLVEEVTGRPLLVEHFEDRPFDVRAIVLDTRRLANLIDWRPVGLAEGIIATWSVLTEEHDPVTPVVG